MIKHRDLVQALGFLPSLDKDETKLVWNAAQQVQETVLQIGTRAGDVTVILLHATEQEPEKPTAEWPRVYAMTNATMFKTVDIPSSPESVIIQAAYELGLNPFALTRRFCLYFGTSQAIAKGWRKAVNRPLDLIYLECEHPLDNLKWSVENWYLFLKPSGCLVTHCLSDQGQQLIHRLEKDHRFQLEERAGQVSTWRKNSG